MEYVLFNDVRELINILKEEKFNEIYINHNGLKNGIEKKLLNEKKVIIKRMGEYFRTLDERTLESLMVTFNNIQMFSSEEDKEYYEIIKAIVFGAKADVKFNREMCKYK